MHQSCFVGLRRRPLNEPFNRLNSLIGYIAQQTFLQKKYLVDSSKFIWREVVMRLPSSLGSSWQTEHNKRTVRNVSCPLQPGVHHRDKVLISRIAVIVIELYEQVVKFIAIVYKK